jgi:hypothetical protein
VAPPSAALEIWEPAEMLPAAVGGGGYFSGTVSGYAGANGEVVVYY